MSDPLHHETDVLLLGAPGAPNAEDERISTEELRDSSPALQEGVVLVNICLLALQDIEAFQHFYDDVLQSENYQSAGLTREESRTY